MTLKDTGSNKARKISPLGFPMTASPFGFAYANHVSQVQEDDERERSTKKVKDGGDTIYVSPM